MSPKSGKDKGVTAIKDFFHTGRFVKDRPVFADDSAHVFKCRMVI